MLRLFHKLYDFIIQEVSLQKNSLFLWSPFFLAIGIALYFTLRVEPPYVFGLAFVLGSGGAVLATFRRRDNTERERLKFLMAFMIFLIGVGFAAAQVRTALVYTPMLNKALGPVNLIGTVERVEPQGLGKGSRIVLSNLDIERLEPDETPRKVRLKLYKDEGILSGQRIKVLAKLNPPSAPVSPGAFDFQRYAFFKGLGAVGFIYNQPEILKEASGHSHFWAKARERLSQRVEGQLEGRQGAIANALMTGQRGSIEKQDIQAMRDAGLAHLLAISGMHVGMIVGVLFFFSRLFMAAIPHMALHYPIKKYAAVFALVGAIFYTLIVGATIPTQRALMMSGLVLIAIILDRTAISLRLVALAAFVVLFFSPESLVSVSFQMSFAAVVALVCFYERISPYWVKLYSKAGFIRRATLYLAGVILTTLVAGFATGFFALYHFQTFALYGTIANIISVPIMAFIVMPALLLAYLLMPIGLEGFALDVAGYGISWILASAHWTANMDGAVSRFVSFPFFPFVIIVICLWCMCLWRGALNRIALTIACLAGLSLIIVKQPTIQISSDYKLVSVRDDNGHIIVSSGRQDRYTADNWLRRNGQNATEKLTFPKEGKLYDDLNFRCDVFGCRGEIEGTKVAYSKSLKSIQDDCLWADLILSENPVSRRDCKAEKVVDRFDVWRNGSHAIWLNNGTIKIETDQKTRGTRPWNNRKAR